MPRNTKPDLYALRKALPEPLTRTYMSYTIDQLRAELTAAGVDIEGSLGIQQEKVEETVPVEERPDLNALFEAMNNPTEPPSQKLEETAVLVDNRPTVRAQDPAEMPGQRLNTKAEDEPIRVDEQGRLWFQEEVRKPAYPKPRGRRVLKYLDTGVKTETVQNGEYVETFEVAGQGEARPAEVKITLPSYQVGIYKDRRFPFKIHCYDGRQGFDLFEVQRYYGGSELVPSTIKRVYIENDLCYEIRSTIQTIQAEHRQLQLTGRIK